MVYNWTFYKFLQYCTCSTTFQICGQEFYRSDTYRAHVNRHNKQKTEECSICGKLFYTKAHLKEHMISHTKEKTHLCTECGA